MTSSNLLPRCGWLCVCPPPLPYLFWSVLQSYLSGAISQAVVPQRKWELTALALCFFYFCPWLPPSPSLHMCHQFPSSVNAVPPLSLIPQLTSPVHSHVPSLGPPLFLPSYHRPQEALRLCLPIAGRCRAPHATPCYHSSRLWKQINISWMNGQTLNPPCPKPQSIYLKDLHF